MKKFMAMVLALGLALSLCACGGGNDATKSAPEAAVPDFVGDYKLAEVVSGDAYKTNLEEATALGYTIYLFVKEDGTGEQEFVGVKEPRTWDDKAFYGVNALKPEEPATYEYADGILTLSLEDENDPAVLKFAKLTAEEKAYYDENGSGNMDDYLDALTGTMPPEESGT